jgi:citrate synthase
VEVNLLRELRNQITEQLNAFRQELHDYRTAVCEELRRLYDEYAERLAKMYCMEVASSCEKPDKA